MKALHFGAGKIGRGFIGAALAKSGYSVTFADTDAGLVACINRAGSYRVHIVDYNSYTEEICGVAALLSDSEQCIASIAQVQIITTAVSMGHLKDVAPIIARGLRQRCVEGNTSPLNIICCENGIRATSQLKALVFNLLDAQTIAWADKCIGFADSAVDRIVPTISTVEGLDVAVEEFFEWKVDRSVVRGEIAPIEGMQLVDNLDAAINRKLFTLNTAHCATAYFGAMVGCKFIHEAIADSWIEESVRRVIRQSSAALVSEFGIDVSEQKAYAERILSRFANPHIKDTVSRVARDPIRKLSAPLYFTTPINMAVKHNLPYNAIAAAAAAALKYRAEDDAQSLQVAKLIDSIGLEKAISQITSLTDLAVIAAIAEAYYR